MSDLPMTNWVGVAVILLLLFLAALAGPGSRPPPVASPPSFPRLDLSLWISGRSLPFRAWPVPTARHTPLLDGSWSGFYNQQFAGVGRRLRR